MGRQGVHAMGGHAMSRELGMYSHVYTDICTPMGVQTYGIHSHMLGIYSHMLGTYSHMLGLGLGLGLGSWTLGYTAICSHG